MTMAKRAIEFSGALLIGLSLLVLAVPKAIAGGPRYVAGVVVFDPSVKGVALNWPQGQVYYFTDPGDLSPIVPHASADALVGDAFSQWSSIPTVALAASNAGTLAEDVDGTNVTGDPVGGITVPGDIQPGAIGKPVAIVYDADGAVTDALLGAGAGGSWDCFTNAVFGAVDNFTSDAHLAHALVVMNGNCAQTSAQLPDVEYRLVRVLGRVLGLDWSQLNLNVITGQPQHPTAADFAGFPVMHDLDPVSCTPITVCYPNPYSPKLDDRAAMARLYPVTLQNLAYFPGKQITATNTARIRGTVRFVDGNGQPAQPMQGVNVVARWIDPATQQRSRQYSASSVSGFLFRGNAGNTVTGLLDYKGQRWDRFGSDDPALEGFYDLGGIVVPGNGGSAQYEISVEALDPARSTDVGPYGPWQVKPSGAASPIVVTVTSGGDTQQDILMAGSASQAKDLREPESFDAPAPLPQGGDWIGSLSGYGDADYFWFAGQANRTLSVETTALDENGAASQDKAQPVVGMWALIDVDGTSPGAATSSSFNTSTFGLTRLDAVLLATTNFRLGIADLRGDGRPDYLYRTRVFYGDQVTSSRASAGGGDVIGIRGTGFRPGTTVTVGNTGASVLSLTADLIVVSLPPLPDGLQSIQLADPATGAASAMTDVMTYGAGPTDTITLVAGANPTTPAGGEAANPIQVRVLASDGTPVAGASVTFSVSPSGALSVCRGAASCTVLSDESGQAWTRVTPLSAGTFTVKASLPGVTNCLAPRCVQSTLSAQSSSLDIALLSSFHRIAKGASVDVPVTARVLSNGSPLSGRTVSYQVMVGNAHLTSASVSTNASGYATSTLQIRQLAGDVQVSACVMPGSAPCRILYITAVLLSDMQLQVVADSVQVVGVGQPFQPVAVRVTDSSSPPYPVEGASVTFWQVVFRSDGDAFAGNEGGQEGMPIILSSTQAVVLSDASGVAAATPSAAGVAGAVEIDIMAMAGTNAFYQFEAESIWINLGAGGGNSPGPGVNGNDSGTRGRIRGNRDCALSEGDCQGVMPSQGIRFTR
jgi:hypothetical protein